MDSLPDTGRIPPVRQTSTFFQNDFSELKPFSSLKECFAEEFLICKIPEIDSLFY